MRDLPLFAFVFAVYFISVDSASVERFPENVNDRGRREVPEEIPMLNGKQVLSVQEQGGQGVFRLNTFAPIKAATSLVGSCLSSLAGFFRWNTAGALETYDGIEPTGPELKTYLEVGSAVKSLASNLTATKKQLADALKRETDAKKRMEKLENVHSALQEQNESNIKELNKAIVEKLDLESRNKKADATIADLNVTKKQQASKITEQKKTIKENHETIELTQTELDYLKDTRIPQLITAVKEKSSQITGLGTKLSNAKAEIAKGVKKANELLDILEILGEEILDLRDDIIARDEEIALLRRNYYEAVKDTLETEGKLEEAMNGNYILTKSLLDEKMKNAAIESSLDITTRYLTQKLTEIENLKTQNKVEKKIAEARIKELEGRLSKASLRINSLLASLRVQVCSDGIRGWVFKWLWKAMLATMGVKGAEKKSSTAQDKEDENKVKEAVATATNSNKGSKSQLQMIEGVVGVMVVSMSPGAGNAQKAAAPAAAH